MINYITLYKKLKKFGNPPEKWLPMDYWPKELGGGGRTLHDDWGIMSKNTIVQWFQPWQKIPRVNTAYAIPLPIRKKAGTAKPVLMPVVNDDYPIISGTKIVMRDAWDSRIPGWRSVRHIWTMMSVGEPGTWSVQEAFINSEWVECYWSRHFYIPFTKHRVILYSGLKIDQDGPMFWYPEVSGSIKWAN